MDHGDMSPLGKIFCEMKYHTFLGDYWSINSWILLDNKNRFSLTTENIHMSFDKPFEKIIIMDTIEL